MGSGASNVKPHTPSSDSVENVNCSRSVIHDKSCTGKLQGSKPAVSDEVVHCHEQLFTVGKNISSPVASNLNRATKSESKERPTSGHLLPPIKKSSNLNRVNSVLSLTSSSTKSEKGNEISMSDKLKQLEQELATSESERLDAEDRIRILESRLKNVTSSSVANQGTNQLNETVHAKDQYIVKLEKDMKNLQAESNTMRLKLKKRIKGLVNQLHEARQDASITQMELKQDISKHMDKIKSLSSSYAPEGASSSDSGNGKLIVELSNQLSEQEEKIASLEAQVIEKDLLIQSLQSQCKEKQKSVTYQSDKVTEQPDQVVTGDRLQSGRGSRYQSSTYTNRLKTAESQRTDVTKTSSTWQSTALSDSDSDWDTSEVASHTHSAPARVRVKSAASVHSVGKAKLGGILQSDDDSIMQYLNSKENSDIGQDKPEQRVKSHKKSVLKNHLEKRKVENEMSALMGPSLAFASHSTEAPSDTSCEPTPRNSEPPMLPGFSKLTVINTTHY